MGRPEEAAAEVKRGLSPQQIANKWGITISAVNGYLWRAVGERRITRADIIFVIPLSVRQHVETLIGKHGPIDRVSILKEIRNTQHAGDAEIYLDHRRVVYGDLYSLLHDIEIELHKRLKEALMARYGEKDWWDQGIPSGIKDECRGYADTGLRHLLLILQSHWPILNGAFSRKLISDKERFFSDFKRLIRLRNAVMHPVKGYLATKDDYDFCGGVLLKP